MESKSSHYYVPQQSSWPILGALALLVLAVGSLNLTTTWGLSVTILGLGGLFFMIGGWISSVIKESNAGLYNQQMDNTFRWGMFWFLVAELFLFGLLIGSLFHVRFSITAWLAGQSGTASALTHYLLWPDFAKHWPLMTPPGSSPAISNPPSLITMRGIPFFNLLLLLLSAVTTILSVLALKKDHSRKSFFRLIISTLLGSLFLVSQTYYFVFLINTDIISKTGVYGSFLIAFIGLQLINIAAALLLFLSISIRLHHKKVTQKNSFSLEAGAWWWCFLAGV